MRSTAQQPPVTQLRINETINGRPYVIDVKLVGVNQWRAQLARREATTALMPFYGPTPDAAAAMLTRWLSRAGA
jgi:hypothetical protein